MCGRDILLDKRCMPSFLNETADATLPQPTIHIRLSVGRHHIPSGRKTAHVHATNRCPTPARAVPCVAFSS